MACDCERLQCWHQLEIKITSQFLVPFSLYYYYLLLTTSFTNPQNLCICAGSCCLWYSFLLFARLWHRAFFQNLSKFDPCKGYLRSSPSLNFVKGVHHTPFYKPYAYQKNSSHEGLKFTIRQNQNKIFNQIEKRKMAIQNKVQCLKIPYSLEWIPYLFSYQNIPFLTPLKEQLWHIYRIITKLLES